MVCALIPVLIGGMGIVASAVSRLAKISAGLDK